MRSGLQTEGSTKLCSPENHLYNEKNIRLYKLLKQNQLRTQALRKNLEKTPGQLRIKGLRPKLYLQCSSFFGSVTNPKIRIFAKWQEMNN